MSSNNKILWPYGPADQPAPAFAAVISIDVFDNRTIVDMPPLTGACTVDLVISGEIRNGAEIFLNVDQDAAGRNVTLGDGFLGDNLVGVANDKDTIHAIYNEADGAFRVVSNHKTVDAA